MTTEITTVAAATPTETTVQPSELRTCLSKFHPDDLSNTNQVFSNHISRILEMFRASDDRVYNFDANLNYYERAVVHRLCRKMGMTSKSSGKGCQQRVSVCKKKANIVCLDKKEIPGITFSEESKRVLMDLFIHYPPLEDGVGKQNFDEPTDRTPKSWGKSDDIFCKPGMRKAEIVKRVESLASKIEKTPMLKKISEQRAKLPIASFRDVITSTVAVNQVVLICGETGCGKTTQVPQYLLDDMWAKGEDCKIICAPPRRISAMSVAQRISQERGENIGGSVGYKIRLNTKGGKHSSILFCTNGVILRTLVSQGSKAFQSGETELSQITHIIVDEIHERDRFSDFILAILRDVLPSNPHLRLVLMSATIDTEKFSQYFGGCPIIRVPGFTHPVKTFYLEEVVSMLRSPKNNHINSTSLNNLNEDCSLNEESRVALDEAIEIARANEIFDRIIELVFSVGTPEVLNYQHSSTGMTALMVFAAKGRVCDIRKLLSLGTDCHLRAHDGSTALDWAMRENQLEAEEIIIKHMVDNLSSSVEEQKLLQNCMTNSNPQLLNGVLIEKLLRKICMESENGAILVFLPGWDDINRIHESLSANPFFKDPSKFQIFSLHSMVPIHEQKKVFKRPPPGCRKIILSTNVAETAITIDDVVYVIDSGRMKEKSYDPYKNVSTLWSSWTSHASAKQREGRAGRCQPGVCYRLYFRLRAVSFLEFPVPEIKRMPIEELCLQIKLLDPNCKIEEFLKKTLDPPVPKTIKNAVNILQEIGALSVDEGLTELGKKLGSLPVHPLISKMLFFAILMNCLDPALTLACVNDSKDPFTLPLNSGAKKSASNAKAKLASLYGGYSDQLAIVAAFDCWKNAKEKGRESRFCSEYFVSASTMHMLSDMRKKLQNELIRAGFISSNVSSYSMNAREPGILHALLVAAFYPKVGRLHPPRKKGKRFIVKTANDDRFLLHPCSVSSKLDVKDTDVLPLLVYDEVTNVDGGSYSKKCTIIGPLSLVLLATEIVVASGSSSDNGDDVNNDGISNADRHADEMEDHNETGKQGEVMSLPENAATIIVDRWLSFKCSALEVAQIYCLRERLSAAILFKVTDPKKVLPPALERSVYAIACVIAYDGLRGMPITRESMESLSLMVNKSEICNSSAGKNEAKQASMPLISVPPHQIPFQTIPTSVSMECWGWSWSWSSGSSRVGDVWRSQRA